MKAQESKLKILVCEADGRILVRLDAWVKAMGNIVTTCDDGIIALEVFKEEEPDIVLLSQELKSMGSLEFIESVKEINPSQAIILMLNADSDTSFFKASIDLQVDKYLNKPIEATPLFNAVESLSQEKLWHAEFKSQSIVLQDYKDAVDTSFSVSKHNKNGEIFYVNEMFCKAISLTYEEAMQGIINPLNNTNIDMDSVWDTLHKDKIYRDRQIFKFEDKSDYIIDITAVGMLDENSEINEYLVFSNDVTQIVNAAREIREQDLKQKRQAQEHLKEVDKIKDSFLTVFTHELKTPLNSIINFSEYVKKHLSKEDFVKKDRLVSQVAQINASGWDMLNMITNLIDSMALKDDNIQLNKSTFLLNDAVEDILNKNSENLSELKVIKLYKNDIELYSDEERVKQIISSLLSNAIKYSNSKIALILRVEKDSFFLEVLDDGEGFEDTTKVFDLFSQSQEDNMTRTAQGTGVGLYIVKKLCDIMSYRVDLARSKNLGGARVVISGKIKE